MEAAEPIISAIRYPDIPVCKITRKIIFAIIVANVLIMPLITNVPIRSSPFRNHYPQLNSSE